MEKWSINLPPREYVEAPVLQKNITNAPIKIMHLTDIHYDPLYLPGSNADCYESEICCQRESTLKENGTYVPAGYWGDYHTCDVPWHSIQNAFDDIKARNVSITWCLVNIRQTVQELFSRLIKSTLSFDDLWKGALY